MRRRLRPTGRAPYSSNSVSDDRPAGRAISANRMQFSVRNERRRSARRRPLTKLTSDGPVETATHRYEWVGGRQPAGLSAPGSSSSRCRRRPPMSSNTLPVGLTTANTAVNDANKRNFITKICQQGGVKRYVR